MGKTHQVLVLLVLFLCVLSPSGEGKASFPPQVRRVLDGHLRFVGKKVKNLQGVVFHQKHTPFLKEVYGYWFPTQEFFHYVDAPYGRLHFVANRQSAHMAEYSPKGKLLQSRRLSDMERKELWYYARELLYPLWLPVEQEFRHLRYEGTKKMRQGPLAGRKVRILVGENRRGEMYRLYFSKLYGSLLMVESTVPYGPLKGRVRRVFYEDYRSQKGILYPRYVYLYQEGRGSQKWKIQLQILTQRSSLFSPPR